MSFRRQRRPSKIVAGVCGTGRPHRRQPQGGDHGRSERANPTVVVKGIASYAVVGEVNQFDSTAERFPRIVSQFEWEHYHLSIAPEGTGTWNS